MRPPKKRTRAVILAAGRGTRLGNLTAGLPKVMVELEGQTLLAHQRRSLESSGITDIHLVLGHGAEAVQAHPDTEGLTCWLNPYFATTNMVASLLCAPDLLDGSADLIIAYGDIVYEPRLLHALLALDAPVGVVVDASWRAYWEARMPDPLSDAETLRMDMNGRILELGSKPTGYSDIDGQYTGLIRLMANDAPQFLSSARDLILEDVNSYMTALLQRLIDEGVHVQSARVSHGWLEIDSPGDLLIDWVQFYAPTDSGTAGPHT